MTDRQRENDNSSTAAAVPNPSKPCPFCGEHTFQIYRPTAGRFVKCDACGCATKLFLTDGEALAAWNRRAGAIHDDLLEALKLLVADVEDYPAWQRPCHALDVAHAAIARARVHP